MPQQIAGQIDEKQWRGFACRLRDRHLLQDDAHQQLIDLVHQPELFGDLEKRSRVHDVAVLADDARECLRADHAPIA